MPDLVEMCGKTWLCIRNKELTDRQTSCILYIRFITIVAQWDPGQVLHSLIRISFVFITGR